jgi:uncharacterized membrane protein (DUF106 family)
MTRCGQLKISYAVSVILRAFMTNQKLIQRNRNTASVKAKVKNMEKLEQSKQVNSIKNEKSKVLETQSFSS